MAIGKSPMRAKVERRTKLLGQLWLFPDMMDLAPVLRGEKNPEELGGLRQTAAAEIPRNARHEDIMKIFWPASSSQPSIGPTMVQALRKIVHGPATVRQQLPDGTVRDIPAHMQLILLLWYDDPRFHRLRFPYPLSLPALPESVPKIRYTVRDDGLDNLIFDLGVSALPEKDYVLAIVEFDSAEEFSHAKDQHIGPSGSVTRDPDGKLIFERGSNVKAHEITKGDDRRVTLRISKAGIRSENKILGICAAVTSDLNQWHYSEHYVAAGKSNEFLAGKNRFAALEDRVRALLDGGKDAQGRTVVGVVNMLRESEDLLLKQLAKKGLEAVPAIEYELKLLDATHEAMGGNDGKGGILGKIFPALDLREQRDYSESWALLEKRIEACDQRFDVLSKRLHLRERIEKRIRKKIEENVEAQRLLIATGEQADAELVKT